VRSDKPVNTRTVGRNAAALVNYGHDNADDLVDNFLVDGTVLVWSTELVGAGSPNYIDNARRLSPEHLKMIDNFIDAAHEEGGSVSIPQIADELHTRYPDVLVSEGAIRYAVINYCNASLGYQYGDVHQRKCQSDPERMDVKRTYIKDYSEALKLEKAGTHICVYLDESYIHQNHAKKQSWLKCTLDGVNPYINRGSGKGKRLIILHAVRLLLLSSLLISSLTCPSRPQITKDGPLVTRDEDGKPICDFKFGRGQQKDIAHTCAAGLTAEALWTASQSTGDYQ